MPPLLCPFSRRVVADAITRPPHTHTKRFQGPIQTAAKKGASNHNNVPPIFSTPSPEVAEAEEEEEEEEEESLSSRNFREKIRGREYGGGDERGKRTQEDNHPFFPLSVSGHSSEVGGLRFSRPARKKPIVFFDPAFHAATVPLLSILCGFFSLPLYVWASVFTTIRVNKPFLSFFPPFHFHSYVGAKKS